MCVCVYNIIKYKYVVFMASDPVRDPGHIENRIRIQAKTPDPTSSGSGYKTLVAFYSTSFKSRQNTNMYITGS